ncbi:hypothetical protein NKH84_26605 [Mesorhizobium sp. M0902]|uniref:hypothetical protein n=1 Tax=unclassified Mesorhizobium TaxID=325217 RepID=UPI00333D6C98
MAEADIAVVKSVPDLFTKLGLQVKAQEIGVFLEEHMDELIAAGDNWGLMGDFEDSEIDETTVIAVDIGL